MTGWDAVMAWNRVLHIAHLLAWVAFTLCGVGCDLRHHGEWAITEVVTPFVVTEIVNNPAAANVSNPAAPTPAAPEVSPDCTCGPECPCRERSGGPCQCDAETAKKIAALPVVKRVEPPLVIHVWPSGCVHGQNALAAILPKLAEAKWVEGKHYRVVKSYDGPCPQFSWKGKLFSTDGWPGWEQWNSRLKAVMNRPASKVATDPPKSGVATSPPSVPVVRVIVGESKAGGVITGPSEVLTASHVAHAGWPQSVEIDGTAYSATVIGDDPQHDLALLRYDGPTVPSIAVARSEPAEGTPATAYGFPLGGALQKHATALSRRWNGFSAIGLYHSRHPFVPGDSGGPVVNGAGELVGIVTGTDTRARVGLVVDQPSIAAFLDKTAAASQLTDPEGKREAKAAGGVAQDVSTPLVFK